MSGPLTRVDEDGLAVITLDNGDLNLFDATVMEAYGQVSEELAADPPRGVLFRAEGRVVSGGVNVEEFTKLDVESGEALWHKMIAIGERIFALPCPTVFCAHALTLTAAFEIALACDIIVAAESAKFGLVERVVGLTPAMGGTQRLAERAGTGRAREFVMTGGLYDAPTLERWNVVNRVVADGEADAAARAFARDLADGPTKAHAATKAILRAYMDHGVDGANAVTPAVAGALFGTEDLQHAIRSFLDEGPGKATFTGR